MFINSRRNDLVSSLQVKITLNEKKEPNSEGIGSFVSRKEPFWRLKNGVWAPVPTGGGIKSREEQPGGELASGQEGPKVPEGLGGTPIKHEPFQHSKHPSITSLKRSVFPRKRAEYQKGPHPTVLTHGRVPLLEKSCFL